MPTGFFLSRADAGGHLNFPGALDFVGFDYYGNGPFNTNSTCTTLLFALILIHYAINLNMHAGADEPMSDGLKENYHPTSYTNCLIEMYLTPIIFSLIYKINPQFH